MGVSVLECGIRGCQLRVGGGAAQRGGVCHETVIAAVGTHPNLVSLTYWEVAGIV